jgi:hypothetical protein
MLKTPCPDTSQDGRKEIRPMGKGIKKPHNANSSISTPEAASAGIVALNHSPPSMDLSAVKGTKMKEQKC